VLIMPHSLQCDDLGRFRLLIDEISAIFVSTASAIFPSSSKSRIFCFHHLVRVVRAQVPGNFIPAILGWLLPRATSRHGRGGPGSGNADRERVGRSCDLRVI
jgi:hypothetical protein